MDEDVVDREEVRSLLVDGLAILRERGLAKYVLATADGQVCARGALMEADGGWWGWEARAADVALGRAARELFPDRDLGQVHVDPGNDCTMVAFNNHDDTTQAEVEVVFEAAIRAVEG